MAAFLGLDCYFLVGSWFLLDCLDFFAVNLSLLLLMLDLHLATALTIKIALLIKSHSLPFNKLTLTAILAFLLPSTKNHQNATRRFSTVIFITTVKIPHLVLFLTSPL